MTDRAAKQVGSSIETRATGEYTRYATWTIHCAPKSSSSLIISIVYRHIARGGEQKEFERQNVEYKRIITQLHCQIPLGNCGISCSFNVTKNPKVELSDAKNDINCINSFSTIMYHLQFVGADLEINLCRVVFPAWNNGRSRLSTLHHHVHHDSNN